MVYIQTMRKILTPRNCISCPATETRQWYKTPDGDLCKSCYARAHREANKETYAAKNAAAYQKNRERILERQSEYYKANAEARKAASKAYYHKFGTKRRPGYMSEYRKTNHLKIRNTIDNWNANNRDRLRDMWTRYNQRHPQYRAFMTALRRSYKLQATPPWLSEEQKAQILAIYEACPKGYHVDHIVPLMGKNVRGLHVPWNLKVIPAEENRKKHNKFES